MSFKVKKIIETDDGVTHESVEAALVSRSLTWPSMPERMSRLKRPPRATARKRPRDDA